MENQKPNHAKTTFLYLLSLVALIFIASSSGIAIFQIINKYIADFAANWGTRYADDVLKFAISALIVATPVYYVTIKFINKEIAQKRLNNDSVIRKWLTYLILLVTAIVILVWLIVTLNRFLDGELTSKSILKVLTIILVCGSIFSFYLYDIKRDLKKPKATGVKIFFYSSLVAIIITLLASFFTIDPPALSRKYRIDGQTINKLDAIFYAIDSYHANKNELPESLEQLADNYQIYPLDDQSIYNEATDKKIEYKAVNDTEYTLCTDFLADTADTSKNSNYSYIGNSRWDHQTGYNCFDLEVNNMDSVLQDKLDTVR